MELKQKILTGLAEILEVPEVTPETQLGEVGQWDSLCIVCTIALLDEQGCGEVSGEALMACETAADVLKLAGATP